MPVIATNLAANSAVRYLNINSAAQTSSLSKLASGSRITQASDDAAGLAISTKISSDVTALTQAATNASHGISVLQTADGGASNISDILQRMKALASQSASGTVTNNERAYIDAEFKQLVDEVDAISVGTRYNGQSLLNGSSAFAKGISVMVGSDAADTITVALSSLSSAALGFKDNVAHTGQPSLKGELTAKAIGTTMTEDVNFIVNGTTVNLSKDGGGTTAGQWTVGEIGAAISAALTAAGNTSVTVDATTAKITSKDNGGTVTIGDLSGNAIASLDFQTTAVTAAGPILAEAAGDAAAVAASSTATQAGAKTAIQALDKAINTVSAARANIGSLESRFGFHQASIATSVENLTAAVSAIKDTDVASEAAKLASSKVKTQAAVAAAAQASQMPQDLLKLLQ